MEQQEDYFNRVKQECILDCKNHSLEEIGERMFEEDEIVDLFLSLEQTDEAYSIIIDLMRERSANANSARFYVPGCGSGGLARRILKAFPDSSILEVDKSPVMIAANKRATPLYASVDFVTADISDYLPKQNSIDMIVAYGIMRYLPFEKRDDILFSWSRSLAKGGIALVGEGVAKDVVAQLHPKGYHYKILLERSASLFRCSLFYLLFQKYRADDFFRNRVLDASSIKRLDYAQVLRDLAGFVPGKVFARMFVK